MTRTAISATALQELLDSPEPVRLLDVRSAAEFESAHIPGSYNVPLDHLGEHKDELAKVSSHVVLICQSGDRANKASDILAAAGKAGMQVLTGGVNAWQAFGGQLNRGPERWLLERQVRLVAGGIVLSSIVASAKFPKAKWLAGGIGGGLTFAALSNTCAMGAVLMKLPYNQVEALDPADVIARLKTAEAGEAQGAAGDAHADAGVELEPSAS